MEERGKKIDDYYPSIIDNQSSLVTSKMDHCRIGTMINACPLVLEKADICVIGLYCSSSGNAGE